MGRAVCLIVGVGSDWGTLNALVVKLFNAILVASQTNPANPADLVNNERKSKKEKDNILGRGGKEERLTKEGFLDMIKAGGK